MFVVLMIPLNITVVELSFSLGFFCMKYLLYDYVRQEIPGWQGQRVESGVCVCVVFSLSLSLLLTVQHLERIMSGVGGRRIMML